VGIMGGPGLTFLLRSRRQAGDRVRGVEVKKHLAAGTENL